MIIIIIHTQYHYRHCHDCFQRQNKLMMTYLLLLPSLFHNPRSRPRQIWHKIFKGSKPANKMLLRNPLQRYSINPCSYFTIPGLDIDKYHFRESKQANIKLARNPGRLNIQSSPLTFSTYIFEIIHKY